MCISEEVKVLSMANDLRFKRMWSKGTNMVKIPTIPLYFNGLTYNFESLLMNKY